MIRFLFRTALLVMLTAYGIGCLIRGPENIEPWEGLEGVPVTSEALLILTGQSPHQRYLKETSPERFRHQYFSVFLRHEESLDISRWAWQAFDTGETLRPHLQPADHTWFALMDDQACWDNAGNINKPGISLVTTSLRAMPSDQPLVTDPSLPGQGFPFDHLQNSLVNANEPLWLSHNSKNGKWTFVFTSYATGWIQSRDVALIPSEHVQSWPDLPMAAFIEDEYPVRNSGGQFLFTSRVGMVLPLVEASSNRSKVLIATSKNPQGKAEFEIVTVSSRLVTTLPMSPTAENLATVAINLLGRPYGWGGLHENRDCSSTIRDFFMPFGLWLPRNSREQAAVGRKISLADLSEDEKAELILREGAPFATLLHKKGHILLYVGHNDGYPVVLHSVWDLTVGSTRGTVRRHVGEIVLSTLRPIGQGTVNAGGSTMLSDLESMNILETESSTK